MKKISFFLFFIFIFSSQCFAVTQNLINLDYEVSSPTAILDELISHFDVPTGKNASNKTFSDMLSEWSSAERKSFYYSYTNYGNQYNFDFWYGSGTGPTTPTSQNLNFRPSKFFRLNSWRGGAFTASYQYDSSFERPQPDILYYCCYIDDNNNLWEYSSDNYSVVNGLTPPFTFSFIDESISATTPVGDTAYCVFLDPLQSFQKIGYINDFENHTNSIIFLFAQNYRNSNNVLVNTIGEDMYYLDDNGYLYVNTNTMWSPMLYEIVGVDGPSNFVAHYYIAAGGNVSGDPMFYSGDISYDDNQFFLWKLLGGFGSGSGDSGDRGFGIFGGLYDLFVPSQKDINDFIDDRKVFIENNSGFFLKPSVAFVSILNKMYESGDFIIEIPSISIPR